MLSMFCHYFLDEFFWILNFLRPTGLSMINISPEFFDFCHFVFVFYAQFLFWLNHELFVSRVQVMLAEMFMSVLLIHLASADSKSTVYIVSLLPLLFSRLCRMTCDPHHFFVPHVFSPIKIFWFVTAILISCLVLLTFVWRSLLYNHGICKSLWLWWKPKLETSDWFLTLDCFSFPYLSLSFVFSYPSPIDLLVSVCFLFFLFLLFGCFAWVVIFFFYPFSILNIACWNCSMPIAY